ncbi:unnamed protein product [Aphanomyces euteiches]|uniref:SWIM-type domain-containing protein n=1 Tax=Aphanomyces euteiches TaxID=100861 RepID=A0A6G0WBR6_9STRA|nr:hypothetical protein Ae201684_017160 [Aphanomyces euteiches]KAH9078604.1 hypothetical protein Ae201684P_019684 [Aphanomyces euteiches]KAH9134024.1 hypothetical protein AeRB84_020100 [Aphanomyces euteiches]
MFDLLGDVAVEYSTCRRIEFAYAPAPSAKLLYRTKKLVQYDLLEITSRDEVPPDEMLVRSVVPRSALNFAHAYKHRMESAHDDDAVASFTGDNTPQQELDIANAYYYNANVNNVRHEVLCSGEQQPTQVWRVCTHPGRLSCECNYYFKNAFCCHLVHALNIQKRDYFGQPAIPNEFESARRRSAPSTRRFGSRGRSRGPRVRGGNRERTRSQVAGALVFDQ